MGELHLWLQSTVTQVWLLNKPTPNPFEAGKACVSMNTSPLIQRRRMYKRDEGIYIDYSKFRKAKVSQLKVSQEFTNRGSHILSITHFLCVLAWVYGHHVHAGACGGQKSLNPWTGNQITRVSLLSHWAISPAPLQYSLKSLLGTFRLFPICLCQMCMHIDLYGITFQKDADKM